MRNIIVASVFLLTVPYGVAASERFPVTIVSIPSGATISDGEKERGQAPRVFTMQVPPGTAKGACVPFSKKPIVATWASGATATVADVSVCPPAKGQKTAMIVLRRPTEPSGYELDLQVEAQQAALQAQRAGLQQAQEQQDAARRAAALKDLQEVACASTRGGCTPPAPAPTVTCETYTDRHGFSTTTCR